MVTSRGSGTDAGWRLPDLNKGYCKRLRRPLGAGSASAEEAEQREVLDAGEGGLCCLQPHQVEIDFRLANAASLIRMTGIM